MWDMKFLKFVWMGVLFTAALFCFIGWAIVIAALVRYQTWGNNLLLVHNLLLVLSRSSFINSGICSTLRAGQQFSSFSKNHFRHTRDPTFLTNHLVVCCWMCLYLLPYGLLYN